MKSIKNTTSLLIMCCFLFAFSCNYCNISAKSKKLALIVAVADYPEEGGWSKISSDKDIPLIKNTLLKAINRTNIKIYNGEWR